MRQHSTFIVAGNKREFEHYVLRKQQEGTQAENYVYVDTVDKIRGMCDVHGFFIGTYEKRPDIDDIVLAIKMCNI